MFPKFLTTLPPQPVSPRVIIRFLLALAILMALLAGYFHTTLQQERKRYLRLEDLYVRVRDELGVPETQRLIDQSRQAEP